MQAFPLFIKLKDRPVLLVGGNEAAAAKLRLLLSAGARCTVVAAEVSGEMLSVLRDPQLASQIAWRTQEFSAGDIDGHQLVFSAHDDEADDRVVVEAAKTRQ